jgi:carbon-monoxide dehydrogenase medium subunit
VRPPPFNYYAPLTLRDTIELLHTKEDSKVLAGGQSLIPMLKLRLARFSNIIDLKKVKELAPRIEDKGDRVFISALTTHDTISKSDLIKTKLPILATAASQIADQQIRNRGTIGGNVAHADPSANFPIALLTLDTKIIAEGYNGERVIEINNFYKYLFTTELSNDEVIKGFEIKYPSPDTKQVFLKIARSAITWPIALVGITIRLEKTHVIEARIALGAAGPTPLRVKKAEEFLKNRELDEETILKASEYAVEGIKPISDVEASSEYRKHLLKVLVKRGLKSIVGGESYG